MAAGLSFVRIGRIDRIRKRELAAGLYQAREVGFSFKLDQTRSGWPGPAGAERQNGAMGPVSSDLPWE
jgi:hypothetical protein